MITKHEQEMIRLLSDTQLYAQAVAFMQGVATPLPQKQTNGLLNVSLAKTYEQLQEFIEHQRGRTTWPSREQHIPLFYRGLVHHLRQIETLVPSILAGRAEKPSTEEIQTLKMLLAREFLQHILSENAYMEVKRVSQSENHNRQSDQGRFQGKNRGPLPQPGR